MNIKFVFWFEIIIVVLDLGCLVYIIKILWIKKNIFE